MEIYSKTDRHFTGRLLYLFYFVALLFRYYQNVTPSGMLQPVLYRYNFDYTYWIFDIIGIFNLVVRTIAGSILFDILLFSSCILCFIYPLKHFLAIVFGVLFFIYVLCYNAYIVHHSHPLTLLTLAVLPFFFKNILHWRLLWEGFRYYVCFAYFISFFWKLAIGKSLLFWNMGLNSAKSNLVEYLYYFPDTILSNLYRYLIVHPAILNIGLICVFILEGVMLIGFFTKRFDYFLFWIPIIIHLSTYLFADVYFFEMLVASFVFTKFKKVKKMIAYKEINQNEGYNSKVI